jgi:Resolvase, N terminal domain/Beta-propeller repeat
MDALTRAKCARIYQEKASGAKTERPELMKLLDTARKGDVVIVWNLDRLARSLRQLIDTRVMLNEHGVELNSLTENIDTTTPSGKLTFHIFTERPNGIVVDASGDAYVAGTTVSTDFPTTTGALQPTAVGAGLYGTAFITKLNATGSELVYSTYLGQASHASAIAVDASGDAR